MNWDSTTLLLDEWMSTSGDVKIVETLWFLDLLSRLSTSLHFSMNFFFQKCNSSDSSLFAASFSSSWEFVGITRVVTMPLLVCMSKLCKHLVRFSEIKKSVAAFMTSRFLTHSTSRFSSLTLKTEYSDLLSESTRLQSFMAWFYLSDLGLRGIRAFSKMVRFGTALISCPFAAHLSLRSA